MRGILEYARTVNIKIRPFETAPRPLVKVVRHQYTNYHSILGTLPGGPYWATAYAIIKERVNQAIYDRFDELYGKDWPMTEP